MAIEQLSRFLCRQAHCTRQNRFEVLRINQRTSSERNRQIFCALPGFCLCNEHFRYKGSTQGLQDNFLLSLYFFFCVIKIVHSNMIHDTNKMARFSCCLVLVEKQKSVYVTSLFSTSSFLVSKPFV